MGLRNYRRGPRFPYSLPELYGLSFLFLIGLQIS
jgi:hypothetical protein